MPSFDAAQPAVQLAKDNGYAVYQQRDRYWFVELKTWKSVPLRERPPAWLNDPEIIRWAAGVTMVDTLAKETAR